MTLLVVAASPAGAGTPGWAVLPTPNPGASVNELADVSGVSDQDVWAVGRYKASNGLMRPLAIYWEDGWWRNVDVPVQAGKNEAEFSSVAAIGEDDAWAVGYTDTDSNRGGVALTMRWNGGTWTAVPNPAASRVTSPSRLNAVAATGTDDVWAVGEVQRPTGAVPLMMHWNGRNWAQVLIPATAAISGVLSGVVARAADDAWAVGYTIAATPGSVRKPVVLHWDGRAWSRVEVPDGGDAGTWLQDVAVGQAGDVFASGTAWSTSDNGTFGAPTLIHYDGMGWKLKDLPASFLSQGSVVNDVAVGRTGDVWIAGVNPAGDDFAKLSNGVWLTVEGANPPGDVYHRAIGVYDKVWCVGYEQQPTTGTRTYSEWSPSLH